ncbi:hypothetical protein GALL_506920 [mine drainage metagenome]|uniref:Uncharacterized protein n=1 Tax=mine drainage metagenome TaxID=410659 RepID=A0A1J5PAI1_9ZZZZ
MHRGIRWHEHRGERAGRAGGVFGVRLIGPVDQLGPRHDRIDPGVEERRVHLEPLDMGGEAGAALVARNRLHHRGFAHHHRRGFRQGLDHVGNHRRRAEAADLFIIAQRDLQRPFHPGLQRPRHGPKRQRAKPFHVAGAASGKPPVASRHLPGVRRPRLPIHGHHVGMARQHDAARNHRTDIGVKAGLGAISVPDAVRCDTPRGEIRLDPVDQRQIAIATHRRKRNQPVHQRACR